MKSESEKVPGPKGKKGTRTRGVPTDQAGKGAADKKRSRDGRTSTGIEVSGTGKIQTVVVKRDYAVTDLFGTDNPDLAKAMLSQCLNALSENEMSDDNPTRDQRQFMLAAVADFQPRDMVERMLAVQMAATHVAFIRSSRRMANAEYMPQFEANERAMTKMARTYTAQMEALRKHRNGGKQTVTVQHVNVEDGGQAIVGNVETGGGAKDET